MNILIVEARYHPDVADALVDGATAALEKGGARFERIAMPGVLEVPAAIAIAVKSATPYDGYVALGHGIVLAADEGAARDLAIGHDVGGDAARACLALATFGERLGFMR